MQPPKFTLIFAALTASALAKNCNSGLNYCGHTLADLGRMYP